MEWYQPASAAGLAERERTYEEGRTKPGINNGRRMYVRTYGWTDGRTDGRDGVREPRARVRMKTPERNARKRRPDQLDTGIR